LTEKIVRWRAAMHWFNSKGSRWQKAVCVEEDDEPAAVICWFTGGEDGMADARRVVEQHNVSLEGL
jgi:hypothetical protein